MLRGKLKGGNKASVIYLMGITKQVEEIIFPEAQGVTPDIDTKQAKNFFFPKSSFAGWKNIQKSVFDQKNKNLRFFKPGQETFR